ncbi:hypothetical protein ACEPAI_2262 [Sanghuangporus weigelae]
MSSNRSDALEGLKSQAESAWSLFEQSGSREDIDSAIDLYQAVLDSCPQEHPYRASSLHDLALSLRSRYNTWGDIVDLENAVVLGRETLSLRPDGHPYRHVSLGSLASSLRDRYMYSGRVDDLEESILLHRAGLALRPDGHPDRHHSLGNLANALADRYAYSGRADDLEESISLQRASLVLRPDGHPDRHFLLGNLASSLADLYAYSGRVDYLEESILLERAALALRPDDHPYRHSSLGNLSSSLAVRYAYSGRVEDLEESILLQRTSLDLRPDGHPFRHFSLGNLASSLRDRYAHSGRVDDLEESISLQRAALALRPNGHPDRHFSLGSLASSLRDRYAYSGRVDDLEESILLERAALALRPDGHPFRHLSLGSLASSLADHYAHSGRVDDLEESISLQRAALALRPNGHPDRHFSFGNLASSLRDRYAYSGRADDLEESILLERAALALRPDGHPFRHLSLGNLASSLAGRYTYSGRVDDLEESISLLRVALALQPDGHPARSWLLHNIACRLYTRYEKEERMEDLEECIQTLRQATAHVFSGPSRRLDAAFYWTVLARRHGHQTTLEAYRAATLVIQRALAIRPTLSSQHDFLSSGIGHRSLTLDAASYAIGKGDLTQAVELLEQGRTLLWSHMRGFRTSLERLSEADTSLADRFRNCSCALEALRTSSEPRSVVPDGGLQNQHSIDQMLVQVRRLSEEQEEIIEEVRRIPGFEDFLQAAPFEVLQQAACEGPVIVLNHSEHRCDVLIVISGKDVPCVCIPLDKDFYSDAVALHDELVRVRQEYRVGSVEYDEVLRRVMRILWDRVVSKVVQKLKELEVHEGSRIWWCPTSVLSALPFHAAGPYQGADGTEKHLLDDYISSYTPTLKSLITARSGVADGGGRMLFVADTELPSAKKERDTIRRIRRIEKQLLDDQATPEAVLRMLRRVRWVHFVCHGLLDEEPFNSSLKLSGGNLTLLDIARANLPNAELAFLSACHTAEQHPKVAMDEVLHLSSAMQFCGFRSVIGTMWQLLDRDGPFFSLSIYMDLMREVGEGEVRFKRAAEAVREAALRLRERGDEGADGYRVEMKAERWVNLVHIGA